jgi:hypothetical protein
MDSDAGIQFVRVLGQQQRGELLELLAEGFPQVEIDWAAAFEAPAGETGHGMLLVVDGRPQGGMLSFEKKMNVGGQPRRVVNLSSWYIRSSYRRFAVRMARAVTDDPDTVYVTCTPTRPVQKICLRIGFSYLSQGSIASVPLINRAHPGPKVRIEPFSPGTLPSSDYNRWAADHRDDRHIGVVLRTAADAVPVLWLRGQKIRGMPGARLLFTGDYKALRCALPAMHWYMLRHHGIVGLYLPRIGPLSDLRSVRKPHSGPSLMVKGEIAPEDVNLLYSELLYLRERAQP